MLNFYFNINQYLNNEDKQTPSPISQPKCILENLYLALCLHEQTKLQGRGVKKRRSRWWEDTIAPLSGQTQPERGYS